MPASQIMRYTRGAVFVLVCGLPAHADNNDAIAKCARIASVGDRILCLEDALRQSSKQAAESDLSADVLPVTTKRSETSPLPKAEVPTSAAKDTPILAGETARANENFGLKEQQPPKETNIIQVTVTSVKKNLSNKFIFETEGGQVWLQTDQRNVRYDDTPFRAEIRPASMGSFFLQPDSGGASVRVRRKN